MNAGFFIMALLANTVFHHSKSCSYDSPKTKITGTNFTGDLCHLTNKI